MANLNWREAPCTLEMMQMEPLQTDGTGSTFQDGLRHARKLQSMNQLCMSLHICRWTWFIVYNEHIFIHLLHIHFILFQILCSEPTFKKKLGKRPDHKQNKASWDGDPKNPAAFILPNSHVALAKDSTIRKPTIHRYVSNSWRLFLSDVRSILQYDMLSASNTIVVLVLYPNKSSYGCLLSPWLNPRISMIILK